MRVRALKGCCAMNIKEMDSSSLFFRKGDHVYYSSNRLICLLKKKATCTSVQTCESSQNQLFFLLLTTSFTYTHVTYFDWKKCKVLAPVATSNPVAMIIPEKLSSAAVSLAPKYPVIFKHFRRKSAISVTWKKLSLLRRDSWVTKLYVLMYFFVSSLRATFFCV